MALIQLMLSLLIFCVAIGAIGSFFLFLFDVIKWHKREERVKVRGSAEDLPDIFIKESEVTENGQSERSDNRSRGGDPDSSAAYPAGSGQPDTSAFFDSWL